MATAKAGEVIGRVLAGCLVEPLAEGGGDVVEGVGEVGLGGLRAGAVVDVCGVVDACGAVGDGGAGALGATVDDAPGGVQVAGVAGDVDLGLAEDIGPDFVELLGDVVGFHAAGGGLEDAAHAGDRDAGHRAHLTRVWWTVPSPPVCLSTATMTGMLPSGRAILLAVVTSASPAR